MIITVIQPQIIPLYKQYLKIVLHFANCINKINNTEIDNAKDIDVVIPMFNLIWFSDHYSKKISTFMVILERLTIFKWCKHY